MILLRIGAARGRIGGIEAIIKAILRSIPAHIRPWIELKERSIDGAWMERPTSMVRIVANIPVLYDHVSKTLESIERKAYTTPKLIRSRSRFLLDLLTLRSLNRTNGKAARK